MAATRGAWIGAWCDCARAERVTSVTASGEATYDGPMSDVHASAADWVRPTVLQGDRVRLEPLESRHLDALVAIGSDAAIWTWMPEEADSGERMRVWLEASLAAGVAGMHRPFATVELASGAVVGSTRYLAIEPQHRRIEIGATWLAAPARGRGLNDEAKLLLLRHAFEVLDCQRVEFKTDARNERSRGALAGIGASFEGIARKHMISHGQRSRDSAWYSIVAEEWAAIEAHLKTRVSRHVDGVPAPS
jgi:RimJ/RimL family protein N-acetyltransferase